MSAKRAFELSADDSGGAAGLAFFQVLADANDGGQPGGERGLELAIHVGASFMQDVAPLAVAENDELAAAVQQHGGADLAGECAFGFIKQILASQTHFGSGDRFSYRFQIHERRAQRDIDLGELRRSFGHRLGQRHGAGSV